MKIRAENVFSTIAEMTETLSLTNEPDKLLQTSLDTMAEVLGIETGWVQTSDITGALTLNASRGFTPDMTSALNHLKRSHPLVREVIGLGHRIVISNISSSDMEGIEPFRKAGIRWLIAVPLMTYRIHGILGAASRYRRNLEKHTPELLMVTGRLIATALVKTNLARAGSPAPPSVSGNGSKPAPDENTLRETRNRVLEIQSRIAEARGRCGIGPDAPGSSGETPMDKDASGQAGEETAAHVHIPPAAAEDDERENLQVMEAAVGTAGPLPSHEAPREDDTQLLSKDPADILPSDETAEKISAEDGAPGAPDGECDAAVNEAVETVEMPPGPVKKPETSFHRHSHRMTRFRALHGPLD